MINLFHPDVKRRETVSSTPFKDVDSFLRLVCKGFIGGPGEALRLAELEGASTRVIQTLKGAVPGGSSTSFGGTALGNQFGEWFSQARNNGVGDAIYQVCEKVSRTYSRYNIAAKPAAATTSEGSGVKLSWLPFTTVDVSPVHGDLQVVFSTELLDGLESAGAMAYVRNELMRQMVGWTDTALLAALTGNSAEAQSVATVSDFLTTDYAELLNLVSASAQDNVWVIVTPTIARTLAAHLLTLGVSVPNCYRFNLAGATVAASDSQTAARVTAVNASSLAMYLSEVSVRASFEADIEMDSAPSQTSTAPTASGGSVNLFQAGAVALKAQRTAAIKALTPQTHAHLTSVGFGVIDSPSN